MDIAILGSARTSIGWPFAGGLEMHTHVLAEGLTDRGHDVTVFAGGGDGRFEMERLRPVNRDAALPGRRDLCSSPLSELSEHDSYLDAMLRLSTRRFDLVHLNTVHYLPFACASMLSGAVTGTLHCPPYPWMVHALRGSAHSVRPPSVATVSSTNSVSWNREVAVDRVILNGVDLRQWNYGGGGTDAVWTGRLVPEKAPHLAIDAARLAGMRLSLLGPAHDTEYFATEIEPRLGADVRFIGHRSVAELALVMQRSAVAVVSPMWDEPFGLVVAEALACGTPVAAFDRGAMAELVHPTTGELARPGDVADLARAMRHAATLDRESCRRAAVERFSSSRMVDEYEAWFLEEIEFRSERTAELPGGVL